MAVPFTTEKWHVDFIDEKSIYDKKVDVSTIVQMISLCFT